MGWLGYRHDVEICHLPLESMEKEKEQELRGPEMPLGSWPVTGHVP